VTFDPQSGSKLVLDWDGTCTEIDTLWLVLEQFGDYDVFKRAGEQLMRGEIDYRELMEIEFSTVKNATLGEVTAWLIEHAEIRPGFHELVDRFEPLVLSSGFEELIRPLMAREDVDLELVSNRIEARPGGWHVLWNRDAPCEVCGDWCKRAGLPASPFVYVGDGYSDRCCALAAERVFARAGLAEYLDREGRPYEPFGDLNDVLRALER
jgi:2-hydroxy-3-keto-5-methylthiopentenyl-1-phosphate phosphatase